MGILPAATAEKTEQEEHDLNRLFLIIAACHVDLGSGGRLLAWKVLYDDDFEEEDEARP